MKKSLLIGVCLLAVVAANAQSIRYALNAASDALPGLPNSSIAEGSVFAIYGSGLGPAVAANDLTFPIPKNLGGSTAQVNINGTVVDCLLLYAQDKQVTALMPSSTPTGTGTLTVKFGGGSASTPITVVTSSFGTFAWNQQGSGVGVLTYSDFSLVTPTKAANPGEALIIWGTGLGPVNGDEAAGPLPGDLGLPVKVWVGTQEATVNYAGRSGCCAGLDQVVFTVPDGITGCDVSVAVQIGNTVSNFTDVAIASTGRVCSDNGFLTGSDLTGLFTTGTLRYGGITLTRSVIQTAGIAGLPGQTTKEDDGGGIFYNVTIPAGQLPTNLIDSSSFGSCTVMVFSGQTPDIFSAFTYKSLDAGPNLSISGPAGNRSVDQQVVNGLTTYDSMLGDTTPGNYLDPGNYTISGPGGADIGPFSVQITVPPAITWTNEDSISTVTRANGQLVTWTGGDPNGYVDVTGDSLLLNGDSVIGASFSCRAPTSAGSLTVPPPVLLSLPPSTTVGGIAIPGIMEVSAATLPKRFSTSGLDLGFANYLGIQGKSVPYQ